MSTGDASGLTRAALEVLTTAGGPGPAAAAAWAPGRCTLAGEHVDYAGGQVLCLAVDLGIAAAVRRSGTARYLAASGGSVITRDAAEPAGDLGDRVLAPVVALRARGVPVPALEVGIAATLPAGAGLASSAALMVATATAILRLLGASITARDLASVALSAERDVLGIPCGPLDQRAVIDAPENGALLLDCATGGIELVVWPWPDAVLVGCDTGVHHDVGGLEYRLRRDETESGLAAVGATNCQELTPAVIELDRFEPRDQAAPASRHGGEPARGPGCGRHAPRRRRRPGAADVGEPPIASRTSRGEHPGARTRSSAPPRPSRAAWARGWSAPVSAVSSWRS